MKMTLLCLLGSILLAGCAPSSPSPDRIRQDTAQATHNAVQDAKAVTQGVVEGLKQSRPLDINSASTAQLTRLPGIDEERASRIIANPPYDRTDDLVKKRVVSRAEYDRISGQVAAK